MLRPTDQPAEKPADYADPPTVERRDESERDQAALAGGIHDTVDPSVDSGSDRLDGEVNVPSVLDEPANADQVLDVGVSDSISAENVAELEE